MKTIVLAFLCLSCVATAPAGAVEDKVPVKFFFTPGCRECEEVKKLLQETEEQLGVPFDIVYLNITEDDNIEQLWAWEDGAGKKAEGLIAVVIGKTFLAGSREVKTGLRGAVVEHLGRNPPSSTPPSARRTREAEFGKFGLWAVLGAGLIDGVNPCAFTVLALLISFLTITGVSRSHTLRIGLAFALAVFLTYLLVGLGLFSALLKSVHYRSWADLVYLAVGGVSFVLGVISIHDAVVVYRSRELKNARLKLPPVVMSRIQRVISARFNPRHIFFSALILGFLVSLLELVCTGQIYLPTIILIMRNPALRKEAFGCLILYCSAFIAPLLVVFALVYWGSEIAGIAGLTREYSWLLKLLTGLIFIALAIFLFVSF